METVKLSSRKVPQYYCSCELYRMPPPTFRDKLAMQIWDLTSCFPQNEQFLYHFRKQIVVVTNNKHLNFQVKNLSFERLWFTTLRKTHC